MKRALRTAPPCPAPLDRFVGRERALSAMREALDRGPRVLSVYGPIGQGKSRLLREFAEREARLGASVILVDLARLGSAGSSLERAIESIAGDAPRWLLIDHWEHSADARDRCAELLSRWPSAQLVVASRGRWPSAVAPSFELGPLSYESDREGARSECAELVVDRLARVAQLEAPEVISAWIEIAAQLDGNPLAIEIVAASSTALDATQVRDRVDSLLQASSVVRAALDEQWASLSDAARRALVACSVLRGSFVLEAAEAVIGEASAVDALQQLRDKSVLSKCDRSLERAFVVQRATRVDALVRADATAVRGARERCARYFAAEGERCAALAEHHRSSEALAWLQRERDNILSAAEWAADAGDLALAARCALVLQRSRTGRDAAAFRALLDRLLAAVDAGAIVEPALHAELVRARGNALRLLGQHRAAIEDLSRAAAIADRLGDVRARGRARIDLAATHSAASELPDAERAFREGLDDARASGDVAYGVTASTFLGYLELERGDGARARALLDEALSAARAIVDPRRQTTCLYCLGLIAHGDARLEDAEDYYEQAIAIATAQRDPGHEGLATLMLGVVALERGSADRACALARSARETLSAVDPATAAVALAYVAVALAGQGLAERARESFEVARELLRDTEGATPKALCERLESVVEWAEAREAARHAKHRRAERLVASARARREAHAERESIDLRIAARVVDQWIAREATAAPSDGALVVALDGSWFALAGAPRVSLARHRAAQRLLRALAIQRVEHPGKGLSHATLVSRGWPGQRILESAAALRLRKAIEQLRRAGLASVLETQPGAYALSEAIPVRLSDESRP
ncbi:MAG: hypothetical protein JNK05_05060 [Myxococcales bacterium]|nr:hypothetical protein [Myxococcales bacterium]